MERYKTSLFVCNRNSFSVLWHSTRISSSSIVFVMDFIATFFFITFNRSFSTPSFAAFSFDPSWIFSYFASKLLLPRDSKDGSISTPSWICGEFTASYYDPACFTKLPWSTFFSSNKIPSPAMSVFVAPRQPTLYSCRTSEQHFHPVPCLIAQPPSTATTMMATSYGSLGIFISYRCVLKSVISCGSVHVAHWSSISRIRNLS